MTHYNPIGKTSGACVCEGGVDERKTDLTSQRLFHDEIHGDGFLSPRLLYPSNVTFTCG